MNRPTFVRSRFSAVSAMAGSGSGFPIVAGPRRGLSKEFARAIWPAPHDGSAEPRVRSPQYHLPLSHPASSLPPLPGSHAAGRVPPTGRIFIRHDSSGAPSQWATTNVNAGAVALGYPHGMTGIRHPGSTLVELGRRGALGAVIGVCNAGGMATAACLER